MAVIVPIVSKFDANGVKQAEKELSGLSSIAATAGNAFRSALIPATIALGGLAVGVTQATQAAIADAAAQDALARQLQVSTGATQAQVAAVEEYISAQSRLTATADDELRPALAALVRATNDVTEAQKLLGLAQDISVATGRDLETISIALAKAATGQISALTRLGVPLSANIVKTKDFAAATDELAKTFGGAASRAAQTTEGRIRGLGIAIDETKEAIGAAFIPILNTLLPILQNVAAWIGRNTKAFTIAISAVAGLAAGIIAVNAAMRLYAVVTQAATVATAVWNAVIGKSPLARFALLIAAVVFAFAKLNDSTITTTDALKRFASISAAVIGATGALVAKFAKSIAAGAYLIVKAVEALAKASDFVLRRNDAKKLAGLADSIDRIGQGLDSFEKRSIDFANNYETAGAKIVDTSTEIIAKLKAAFSAPAGLTGTGNSVTDFAATVDAAGEKAARGAGSAAKQVADKAAKTTEQAAEKLRDRLRAAQDRVGAAFGDYTQRALRAYDAQTNRQTQAIEDNLTGRIAEIDAVLRSQLAAITSRYDRQAADARRLLGGATVSELELAAAEAARDQTRATRSLRDAEDDLARVRADKRATADDIRRAEERLADVISDQALDALRERARGEREQRDQLLADTLALQDRQREAEITAAENAAERQRELARANAASRKLELEAERELQRENLQRQLDAVEERLKKEPGLWTKAHENIMRLFADSFGPDYERSGSALGAAFNRGLAASLGRLSGAVTDLNTFGAPSLATSPRASASGPELNLIVNAGIGTNGAAVGNSIVNALQDWQRRNGALPLRVTGY